MTTDGALIGLRGISIGVVPGSRRPDQSGPATLTDRTGCTPALDRCDARIVVRPSLHCRYRVAHERRRPDERELTVRFVSERCVR